MESPRPSTPPLSPQWAFVVQFRVGTELEGGHIRGKVEHVVSGQGDTIATLAGETLDGAPIEGTDSICIVP